MFMKKTYIIEKVRHYCVFQLSPSIFLSSIAKCTLSVRYTRIYKSL